MDILSVGNAAKTAASSSSSLSGSSALDKDAFLKILVAQLQNQDPTQPMSDTEFISQLAQFSSLEQMQQMTAMFSYTQAYSLVGKNITALFTDENGTQQEVTGTVDSVITYNGEPYLSVGGYLIAMNDTTMSVNSTTSSDALLQGASLIGRTVTGTYTDDNEESQNVTGVVTRAAMVDGVLTLTVKTADGSTVDVSIHNVTEIADGSETAAG